MKTHLLTYAPNEDSNNLAHPHTLISPRCPLEETLHPCIGYPKMHPVKILIRLRECAGWSESSPGAHIRIYVFWRCCSNNIFLESEVPLISSYSRWPIEFDFYVWQHIFAVWSGPAISLYQMCKRVSYVRALSMQRSKTLAKLHKTQAWICNAAQIAAETTSNTWPY